MKKSLILFSLSLLITVGSYAQNNKRTSAYMYNKNQQYAKAKEAIDEAVLHSKTQKDAKTWMYRGEIYYNIAESGAAVLIAPDALNISYESLMSAKEFDTKESYTADINRLLGNLSILIFNKAHTQYQNEEYDEAVNNYVMGFNIGESMGKLDTVTAFYIGMIGVEAKKPQIAADYLAKCAEAKYNDPRVYLYYARAEKQLGDTTKAFDILTMGREIYPAESSLQLEEAQLFLETGNNEMLVNSLKSAIELDPENANLYRVLGSTYESVNDEDNAIECYKKAIELNSEYGDAIFNLGAIYVNRASQLYTEANNLPFEENEKYNKLKAEADADLHLALPYLEKSHELNPDDDIVKGALKETYINLKMNDELKELMK